MYELISLSHSVYYIESPAKVGLVKTGEDQVWLIDSGSDKEAGRKIRQHLDKNGWKLQAACLYLPVLLMETKLL